ncbi:sigma factor-like helix-turn-helix DNA-binding protein [Nocardia sp. alder85J]|uniref:sigma factor-like helix-turn-helix DNA-binding protein n=1 Tax=Nocardia sp. alder85J TaxID=2862949 RepID=UPI001CD758E9|nr:sigma factor-like helix-turn-helix DNA-binding protein [Nocardia sp. alder85J]MCX4099102.1 replication protein RepB [Nocardia sp. alder85J]
MAAEHPKRRTKTAKEMAEQLGISVRSVRNIIAEPRENFEARAAEKRTRARELRADGASYREIADELGISIGSVSSLLHAKQTTKAS